ncbi:PP2C family protein-serine/threonine phosphatase [Rhizomonospora bruguierae]|uniref:PP2C family protein-serine/threonine phosphatase n=1 Tax=Rhizomonospora bruguierae TaxID=1581705 RepID=UPI001BCCC90B|nr:PP2C family protein-serine/threonine phosphatase [Micromonospora sp. NBRC 107566]
MTAPTMLPVRYREASDDAPLDRLCELVTEVFGGPVGGCGGGAEGLSDDQRTALRALAAVVADELELRDSDAARLVARDRQRRLLRLAETVQDDLAPALPQPPGMTIAAYGRPAPGEPVGGDFYDAFPLAPGSWGLFLGDVTGKGPRAAALTALSRYTLRTTAILDRDPASTLRDLNTVLLSHATSGDDWLPLCTVAYAQVRPPTRAGGAARIGVACAGHPPPLVIRPGRLARRVECLGMVPGVRADPEYRPSEVDLNPGDALVFYTDGFTDAHRQHGYRLEIDGLRVGLSGLADTSATAIVDRLANLLGDGPEATRDDATALVLSVPATPAAG